MSKSEQSDRRCLCVLLFDSIPQKFTLSISILIFFYIIFYALQSAKYGHDLMLQIVIWDIE